MSRSSPRALAAAQTIPERGDIDANLGTHLRLAHAAADAGARLVLFPELSLTGYELDLASELAFVPDDPRLSPLAQAASVRDVTLVVGAPARIGAHLHIGAFVLPPGRPMALYTKRHLGAFPSAVNPGGPVPPAEATIFSPGELDPLVQLDASTAAIAVCADTARPSHAEHAAARGARTYLASVFVIPSDLEGDSARLGGYAACHGMAVVMANFGGPTGGLPSGGGSAIWSESGELLARLEGIGEGLVIAIEDGSDWHARTIRLGTGEHRVLR